MKSPKPQKVVIFNNMTTPYTARLYNYVSARGIRLEILSCTNSEPNRHWGNLRKEQLFLSKTLRGFSINLSPARYAHFNFGIFETLTKSCPDTLIINGFFPSMAIAALWAVLRGVPLILTIDGWAKTMPRSLYHSFVRRWILSDCSAVIVCSEKGRDYFLTQGFPADSISIVRLSPAWAPQLPPSGMDDRPFDLLWVAQMNSKVKNIMFFIYVLGRLKKRFTNLRVRLIGDGPESGRAIRLLQQFDVSHIHSPSVPWSSMEAIFSSAKLLMLPSVWEPWGLVCNEALQCGTPVIASENVGAAGELVVDGENGRILPLCENSWVEAVSEILQSHQLWQRLSEGALKSPSNTLPKAGGVFLNAIAYRAESE